MAALNGRSFMVVVLGGLATFAVAACNSSSGGGGGSGGQTGASGGETGSGGATARDAGRGDDAATGGVQGVSSGGTTGTGGAPGGTGGAATGGAGNRGSGGIAASGGAPGPSGGASGATAAGGATGHAGHGGGPGGSTGGSSTGGTSGGGGAPASCSGAALPSGNSNRTLQIGGMSRTYILHVPTAYTGAKPVPLVLDFHALGGTGSQEQSSSGYQAIADKQGFIILFPNGIDNAWNIGPCCTNSPDVDDLGFARAMVATTVGQACIDTTRVYAVGFSMGGGMSQYLACNAADVFAAAAPSSFDLLVPDEEPCAPTRPISVLAYRGTADTTVPYAGGPGPSGRITFLGAQGSFQRWAGIDGCTTAMTTDGDCTYLTSCSAGVEVGLCVKQGGGHAPGDANVGWAFLSRFTLP